MSEDDPRHGTVAGRSAGCTCPACRAAKNRYDKRRRHCGGLSVPSQGTTRRLRALIAIGWTAPIIAREAGWTTDRSVHALLQPREYVYSGTAVRVRKVYERLSGSPGPSKLNRLRAAEKGWAPPLAWDDIDTDPAPVEWRSQRRRRPSSELVEDVADLLAAGEHASVIAARLGVTVATLARNLARTAPHLAPPFEKERKRSAA